MMRATAAAAASNPESRNIAPNIASNASARIDARRKPPDFNSPGTQPQVLAQAQLAGDLRQGLAADQRRPQPRQSAFVGLRMRIVEQARHTAIENRIAEEFQPLVVIARRHCGG